MYPTPCDAVTSPQPFAAGVAEETAAGHPCDTAMNRQSLKPRHWRLILKQVSLISLYRPDLSSAHCTSLSSLSPPPLGREGIRQQMIPRSIGGHAGSGTCVWCDNNIKMRRRRARKSVCDERRGLGPPITFTQALGKSQSRLQIRTVAIEMTLEWCLSIDHQARQRHAAESDRMEAMRAFCDISMKDKAGDDACDLECGIEDT